MPSKLTAAVVAAGAASAVLYGAVLFSGMNAVPFALSLIHISEPTRH